MPNFGTCAGTETAAVFGCVLLTSYLGLFIKFYIETYNKRSKRIANGKPNGNGISNGNGKANGHV